MTKKISFWSSLPRPETVPARNKNIELATSHIENASNGCTKYGQFLKRYGKWNVYETTNSLRLSSLSRWPTQDTLVGNYMNGVVVFHRLWKTIRSQLYPTNVNTGPYFYFIEYKRNWRCFLHLIGKRLTFSHSGRRNSIQHTQEVKENTGHRKLNLFSRWSCCSIGLSNRMLDGDRSVEPQQIIFQNANATISQTATSFTDLSSKLSDLEKRDVDSVSIEATLNNTRQHIGLSEKGQRTEESVVAEDETVAPSDGSARQTVDSSTVETEPSIDNRDDGPENGQQTLPDPRSPASTLLPVPPIVATIVTPQEHEPTVHYDAWHYPVRYNVL